MANDNEVVLTFLTKVDQLKAAEAEVARLETELRALGEADPQIDIKTESLKRAQEDVRKIAQELKALPASAQALISGFDAAGAALLKFETAAATGSKLVGRAGAQSLVEIEKLEAQITKLGASGLNVRPLEDRLVALRSRFDLAATTAGKFRKATHDVEDELKQSTLRAGEFEGQVRSLEDLVNGVSPTLGNMASKLLSLQAALGIAQGLLSETGAGVKEFAVNVGASNEDSEKFADLITRWKNPLTAAAHNLRDGKQGLAEFLITLDEFVHKADDLQRLVNLRSILDKQGIDASRLSLEELDATFGKLIATRKLAAQQDQDAEARAKEFASTIRQESQAVGERTAALIRGIEIVRQQGNVTAAAAKEILASLNAQIEAVHRFGRTAPELEELRNQMEAIADLAKLDDLATGARQIERFAESLHGLRKASKEQADALVGDIDRTLKAIRTLAPGEQAVFADRIKILQRYREEFFKFTTEYAKQLEEIAKKQAEFLKKQEATLLDFVKKVQEAGASIGGAAAPDTTELKKKLAEDQAELARLLGQSATSVEDENRIDDLKNEIKDLEIDINRLETNTRNAAEGFGEFGTAAKEGAKQAKEAILDLLTSSDDFKQTFQSLPEEFKQELQRLVTGFVSDLDNGLLQGEEDVQRFISQFTSLLHDGGAVTDELSAKLQALAGADSGIGALFDSLRKGAEASITAVNQAGTAAQGAGEAYIKMGRAAEDSGKLASAATTGVGKLKQETIELSGAALKFHENTVKFRGEIIKVGPAADGVAPKLGALAGKTKEAATAQAAWNAELKRTADFLKTLDDRADKLQASLNKVADAQQRVTTTNPAGGG